MDNQMLKHLLLSFFSKLTFHKIIDKKSISNASLESDEKCFENIGDWIPQKHEIKRKKANNSTPKIFTESLPLDISISFTQYLENKDRIILSLVNSNFYQFASHKVAQTACKLAIIRIDHHRALFKISEASNDPKRTKKSMIPNIRSSCLQFVPNVILQFYFRTE